MTIRLKQLQNADLNLLIFLFVLMEEQSISRAAKRLGLTQPSVSRALQRLRSLFSDELMIRTPKGYEPTQRGQALLDELAVLLPQIDRCITGHAFDPSRDRVSFRICATDNATQLYAPVLCHDLLHLRTSLIFQPWSDHRFVELDRNVLDLVLDAKLNGIPQHLSCESLFEDEFVCLAASTTMLSGRLSMKQYLAQQHIGINVLHGRQTLPELALAAIGKRRRCPVTVPYFTVAMKLVESQPLLATVPRRLAQAYADPKKTRVLLPPLELKGYSYVMYWHPRREHDAQHRWLRQAIRNATKDIAPL